MERLRVVFNHPYELVVRGWLNHALCHKAANGRRGVAETERKRYRGTPYVMLWRGESFSRRPRHVIVVGKGEAPLVLPGLLEPKGGVELVPKPLVVEADGGERLDGSVSPYQLSSHHDDET